MLRRPAIIAACIMLTALALAWISARGDSAIVDEVPHIGAGYSYIQKLDYRLNPEHPPLIKDLAGLMLAPLNLKQTAFNQAPWTKEVNGQWNFGRTLIFDSGNDPDVVTEYARIPALIVFAIGGIFLWFWARQRHGDQSAILALVLYAFSPTLLAHGRFVTTDVPAAVTSLAAVYCFLKYLREPSRTAFAWSALTLGLAFLAKFNTVLLGPLFLITAVLYGLGGYWHKKTAWQKAGRLAWHTALLGGAALLFVVYPVYFIQTLHYPVAHQRSDTQTILGYQPNNPLKSLVLVGIEHRITRPLAQWGLGLSMATQRAGGGNTIYWLGKVVKSGGPMYFPLVYLLKEPLPWLLLCIIAIAAAVRYRKHTRPFTHTWWHDHLEDWAFLLWIFIYLAVSIKSPLNIGIRHLIPIYPFAILLVTGELAVFSTWLHRHNAHRGRILAGTITVLMGWYVFASVSVFPYYLTYFNELAGGPSGGHRYVVDSNLDWGQDAKRLGRWAADNDVSKICVDYFGWANPVSYLGKRYTWTSSTLWSSRNDFIRRNDCNGWIAVSATFLQNSVGEKTFEPDRDAGTYRWILGDKPVTVIGNSIFVWHIER